MNANYPLGAEFDPSAPYNQPEDPESEIIEVTVYQTFRKKLDVEVDDYQEIQDWDEDNGYYYWNDYSGCDFKDYVEEQHLTITDILERVQELYKQHSDILDSSDVEVSQEQKKINHQLHILAEACKGWNEDEMEVVQ